MKDCLGLDFASADPLEVAFFLGITGERQKSADVFLLTTLLRQICALDRPRPPPRHVAAVLSDAFHSPVTSVFFDSENSRHIAVTSVPIRASALPA